jgi:hypothetical protein
MGKEVMTTQPPVTPPEEMAVESRVEVEPTHIETVNHEDFAGVPQPDPWDQEEIDVIVDSGSQPGQPSS